MKYAKRTMILFSAFVILVLYIETMLIPSLPSIAAQYKINAAEVSLIVSLYLVSGVALNPVVGKLGDIYGKKRVLKYILPIYIMAASVTGFAPNFATILISRTIQGIGLTIFPLIIALIREEFPQEMIPRATATISAMFGVGSAIGIPLGSFISNTYGWQYTYHTALPLIIILSALVLFYIKESRFTRPEAKIDYFGATGMAIALAAMVFALSEGSAYGWTSPLIAGLFGISVVLFIALVIYEKKIKEPILNRRMLGIKNVMNSNIITLFAGLGYFFSYQIFAYLFEAKPPLGFGYSIFQTGLAIAPFAIVNAIVAPVAGRYIPRIGVKPFFLAGSLAAIAGFLIVISVSSSSLIILGETVIGIGIALVNMPTINLLVLSVERSEMGLASSMNSVFRFLGSALGAPLGGLLVAEATVMAGLRPAFYLLIGIFILVFLVSRSSDEIFGKNKKVSKIEKEVSI